MTNSPPNAWPFVPLVMPVSAAESELWQAGIKWANFANRLGVEVMQPTPIHPDPFPTKEDNSGVDDRSSGG